MNRIVTMILTAMFLGFIGIFSKLSEMSILSLTFFRLLIATLGMFILIQFRHDCTLCHWKEQFTHNLLGGFLMATTFSAYIAANVLGPITNAVILLNIYPLFVMVFAWYFLHESITKQHIVVFIVAFIGILFINPLSSGVLLANILAFVAAVVYALYVVYLRKHSVSRSLSFLFWSFLSATLFTLPLAIYDWFVQPLGFSITYLWVLPLGLISTALAYFLFSYSLEIISADVGASITMIVMPLVAVLGAVLIFNEVITLRLVFGAFLLVISLVYLQFVK